MTRDAPSAPQLLHDDVFSMPKWVRWPTFRFRGRLPQSTIGPTFFLSTQCLVSGYCACPESQFVIVSYLSAAVEPLQRSVRRSGVLVLVAVQERRSVASASHILLLSESSRTSAETDRAANGLACPACDVAVVAMTPFRTQLPGAVSSTPRA